MMPGKLPPIPKSLLVTDVRIVLYSPELNEDGEPITISDAMYKCIWSDKRRHTYDKEKRIIELEGSIIVDGDVSPDTRSTDGYAVINGEKLKIYKVKRARNPDGSVHHTTLDLI